MFKVIATKSAVTITLLLSTSLSPVIADDPVGTWLTQNSDAQIRVARCGASMCGTIVWIKDPVDSRTGQPPVDEKNPNPSMRNRPLVGLRIFAMIGDGDGNWSGGIYNADDGQTYRGRIMLRGPEQLEVQGCAGIFCGSETWRKVGR